MTRITMKTMVIAVVALAMIFAACGDKATITQETDASPAGKVTGYTSCKGVSIAVAQGETPANQDCIEYTYDGHSILKLTHVNAGFNCCPDSLLAAFRISVGEIIIDESEDLASGGCHCLCLYDLDYVITGLPSGYYNVRVNQPYLKSGASVLDFAIDLTSARSGSFCVSRDFYPWATEKIAGNIPVD